MPRRGGESDKLGNRFEGIWTVGQILELLADRLGRIAVEPVLESAPGIEFVAYSLNGVAEYHSVKRQRSAGDWTLTALCRRNAKGRSVLGDLFQKLKENDAARCSFVSSTGANHLRELTERAERRVNLAEFDAELEDADALRGAFERQLLPLAPDRQTAFDWLRRTSCTLIDERQLTRNVDQRIDDVLYRPDGHEFTGKEVRLLLADHVLDHLGTMLAADQIWSYLSAHGYARRDWANDPSVRESLRRANEAYGKNVELELINGHQIARSEVHDIVGEFRKTDGAHTVLLAASAGCGKSCVLSQVIAQLELLETPVLALRLDRHGDAHNTTDLGRQLNLPRSPSVVLAGMAAGGFCVLVVDQLDAVSRASGRNPMLWDVFDQLREEVYSYPNMRLLIACRSFDLEHDHRLRQMVRLKSNVRRIDLQLLAPADIEGSLNGAGIDPSRLTSPEKEILRTPLHLLLFIEGIDAARPGFGRVADLFDRFWERKRQAVNQRLAGMSQWTAVIDKLCSVLNDRQVLAAPLPEFDHCAETVDAMASEHVLVRESTTVRFFHESFFDYAFARRFSSVGLTVSVNKSPSLARRLGWTRSMINHGLGRVQRWRGGQAASASSFGGI